MTPEPAASPPAARTTAQPVAAYTPRRRADRGWCGPLCGALLALLTLGLDQALAAPPLPALTNAVAAPVAPAQAARILAAPARALALANVVGAPGDAAPTDPEIRELARALGHDPDRIYQYVHDGIAFEPTYGLRKGALATLLDARGNAFDQAALLVALLRAAGITATYRFGEIQLDAARLGAWLGVTPAWDPVNAVLASGGIPVAGWTYPDGRLAYAQVTHVWVAADLGGARVVFDPALKAAPLTSGIDLADALGYQHEDVLAAARGGATITTTSVTQLNVTAVRATLTGAATRLIEHLHAEHPAATLEQIVGGRTITPTPHTPAAPLRQTAHPDQVAPPANWTEVPPTYRATLRLTHLGLDQTFHSADLAARRLTIVYDAANRPQLRLDGTLIATGNPAAVGSANALTVTIDEPYANHGGTYQDQSGTQSLTAGGAYLIATAWGAMGRATLEYHRRHLTEYQRAGLAADAEPVRGAALAVLAASWVAQASRYEDLSDAIGGNLTIRHHWVGIAGQSGAPFVDLPFNRVSTLSRSTGDDAARGAGAFFNLAGQRSAFEHGILEQTQPLGAVSTVKLLDLANRQGGPIFDLTQAGYAALRPQLQTHGYSAGELAQVEAYLTAGFRVLLPRHGDLTQGAWQGIGFLAISADQSAIGHIIGGGLKGGFADTVTELNPVVVATTQEPTKVSVGNPVSADPIDMASGAFLYAHADVSIGSGPLPFGLTLERSYSAANRARDGPLGAGWTHNFAIAASEDSDGFQGMGEDSPSDAVAAIAAGYIALDLLQGEKTAERLLTAVLIEQWSMEQLTGNVVRIEQPGDGRRFVRLPDGSYHPPPGNADTLTPTAAGYRLTGQDGLVLDFGTLLSDAGTAANPRRTFGLDTWTERHGNQLQLRYDPAAQRLTQVDNGLGRRLDFSYDATGRIERIADHTGRAVTYVYDADGNLAGFSNTLGQTSAYCYADGRLTALSAAGQALDCANPQAPFLANTYDTLGRVATQTNANGHTWTYRFAGRRSEEQDSLGKVRAWEYNTRGKVIRTIDALGQASTTDYDGEDRPVRVTQPAGNATAFAYDARHHLTALTHHPKPASPEAVAGTLLSESFTYEPVYHRLLTHTDRRGFVTRYVYAADAAADLERIEQPAVPLPAGGSAAPVTTFTHNARGQLTATTDPAGRVTGYTYAATGDLLRTTVDPTGLALTRALSYDALGNPTTYTDARGFSTAFAYDAERRLIRTTAPLGAVTEVDYDPQGRRIAQRRAIGDPAAPWQTTTATYTPTGQPASITDPAGDTVRYAYDALERRRQVIDPLGQTTDDTYDAAGRLLRVDQPAVNGVRPHRDYAYHPNGTRATVTDPNGHTTAYAYDGFDRQVRTTYPDGSAVQLTLDAAGNIRSRTTRAGQTFRYGYDALNRQTTATRPDGRAFTYGYDRAGQLVTLTEGAAVWSLDYDRAGRLLQAVDPRLGAVAYRYDAGGNRTGLTWPDGFAIATDYDALNRPTAIRQGATALAAYTYDPLSRRLRLTYANDTASAYTYAPNDDLTGLTLRFTGHTVNYRFSYDAAGRRLTTNLSDTAFQWLPPARATTDYRPNALNQYAQVGGAALAYDANGNLIADGSRTYRYDPDNRLTGVSAGGQPLAAYHYDPQGRRSEETRGATTTRLLWAGAEVIGEYDAAGVLIKRFITGPGRDEPIALETGGARYYTHADALGSVIALSNSQGAIVERYAYGPFGETSGSSGLGNPLRYTARRFDAVTGLYDYRYRAYSPARGRFLQPDPAGYSDGFNLYAYVGNNPIAFVDPWGLGAQPGFWNVLGNAARTAAPYVEFGIGVALIAVDVIDTPVSPTPDVGVAGGAMIAGATARIGEKTLAKGVDTNKLQHIFGQERHNLSSVLQQFGSEEKAFSAIEEATRNAVRSQMLDGVFETTIQVGADTVTVRGNVVYGIIKIGTAFKP